MAGEEYRPPKLALMAVAVALAVPSYVVFPPRVQEGGRNRVRLDAEHAPAEVKGEEGIARVLPGRPGGRILAEC